jgi:hypothetical protein
MPQKTSAESLVSLRVLARVGNEAESVRPKLQTGKIE